MDKNEQMFWLVDQWKESGLTRKVFAQQHGITDSKLEYWCRKRDNKVPRTTAVARDFVELLAKQDSKSDTAEKTTMAMPRVELELSGGISIKIY
jgi:hypothetical protein